MSKDPPVPRPNRQEQEPASKEVSEVAPGVLRLQLPIDFTGLGHVNSYVFVDKRGAALVDAGLPGKKTWAALSGRLAESALPLSRLHTVLVTHSHPDHFGSAGRLAHEAGAELVAEQSFHTWLERPRRGEPAEGYLALLRAGRTPWGGLPFPSTRGQKLARRLARHGLLSSMRPPVPTRRLRDGEVISLAGREWQAVHTPGHTGDHLCLYDAEGEVLVSGDHVLPTITPHVGGLSPLADPLGAFLASLARLGSLGPVRTVLPAHGHPFSDLAGRVEEIVDHHDSRLSAIRDAARDSGEATVGEIAQRIFSPRAWGMMAESETYAHLEFLRLRGEAERHARPDGLLVYSVDPGGSSSGRAEALGDA